MSKKVWKDHFLSSGLPLEYSVAQIFEDLGNSEAEEFSYERKNEDGIPQIFSVDIQSRHVDPKNDLWLETLVECKYRHGDSKWVFTPSASRDYEAEWGTDLSALFVALDQCCADRTLDRDNLGKFGQSYPMCQKGIELLPENTNPKSIEQAVRQLPYAVTAKTIDAIQHQLVMLETVGDAAHIFVIVPIIVTTAELWRLRPGMTVEIIRNATEIDEVADRQEVLVLRKKPNNLDVKHVEAAFRGAFTATEQRKLHELANVSGKDGLARLVSYIMGKPSLFLVITYAGFRSALADLYKFFAQAELVRPRRIPHGF
jgi:hypothetical protein